MTTMAILSCGLLLVIAIGWSVYDFFHDAERFIAPDNTERDAINVRHGENSTDARAALDKRFDRSSHWRDAATGVSGLIGLAILFWLWFG